MMTFKPILMLTPIALTAAGLMSTVIAITPAHAESNSPTTQTSITQYSRQTLTQTGVGKVKVLHNQQIDTIVPQSAEHSAVGLSLPHGGMDMTIMRSGNSDIERSDIERSDIERVANRRTEQRQRILEPRSMRKTHDQSIIYPYFPR